MTLTTGGRTYIAHDEAELIALLAQLAHARARADVARFDWYAALGLAILGATALACIGWAYWVTR